MAYNHKKLGKIVAEVLESGGYVSLHKLQCNKEFQTPEQALSFMDRAREVFKVEDRAIIVEDHKKTNLSAAYSTRNEDLKISITATFDKPSTVNEDKL